MARSMASGSWGWSGVKFPNWTLDALVGEAVRTMLLSSNTSLWYALKAYTLEPRNSSHHRFPNYPLPDVARFLFESDNLLRCIDDLRNERQIETHYEVLPVSGEDAFRIKVRTPGLIGPAQGSLRIGGPKAERIVPLAQVSKGEWECVVHRGMFPGEILTASFRGSDASGVLTPTSGTAISVSLLSASSSASGRPV